MAARSAVLDLCSGRLERLATGRRAWRCPGLQSQDASSAPRRWWAPSRSGAGGPPRRREHNELTKIALGSLLAAGAPALLIVAAGLVETTHERVSFVWTLGYTLLNDLGFANILPVGLALYCVVRRGRWKGW